MHMPMISHFRFALIIYSPVYGDGVTRKISDKRGAKFPFKRLGVFISIWGVPGALGVIVVGVPVVLVPVWGFGRVMVRALSVSVSVSVSVTVFMAVVAIAAGFSALD